MRQQELVEILSVLESDLRICWKGGNGGLQTVQCSFSPLIEERWLGCEQGNEGLHCKMKALEWSFMKTGCQHSHQAQSQRLR